jgi:hypothetical protein
VAEAAREQDMTDKRKPRIVSTTILPPSGIGDLMVQPADDSIIHQDFDGQIEPIMGQLTAEAASLISRKITAEHELRTKYPGYTAEVESALVRGRTEPWYYERKPMRRNAKMARRAAELAARKAVSLPDGSMEQAHARLQAAKFWASASDKESALWCEDADPWYIAVPYRTWAKIRVNAQWHFWDRWRNDA